MVPLSTVPSINFYSRNYFPNKVGFIGIFSCVGSNTILTFSFTKVNVFSYPSCIQYDIRTAMFSLTVCGSGTHRGGKTSPNPPDIGPDKPGPHKIQVSHGSSQWAGLGLTRLTCIYSPQILKFISKVYVLKINYLDLSTLSVQFNSLDCVIKLSINRFDFFPFSLLPLGFL